MSLSIVPVAGRSDLSRFIDLAWKVYADDPHWVPPLRADVARLLTRGRHPFHEHAEVQPFLALRDGNVVGRIVALTNSAHNDYHEDRVGFFGFYECLEDPKASSALFEQAFDWLRERGCDTARGPMDLSTNETCGLLIGGDPGPPVVMMPHNRPTYPEHYEASGLTKAKDLVAMYMDQADLTPRVARMADQMAKRGGVFLRRINKKRYNEEVDKILALYNKCWERNWGFVPMTEAEIRHMAKEMRPIVDENLVLFLEPNDGGEPIGFGLALPDVNIALRHANGKLFPFGIFKLLWHKRKIHRIRVLTLGVVPEFRGKGLDLLLCLGLYRFGTGVGYDSGEFSWILEDNVRMISPLEKIGARVYRTYRVYDKAL